MHIIELSLFSSEQISQSSASAILWQLLQVLILLFTFSSAWAKSSTSLVCVFNTCNPKRWAVFFPIPGNLEKPSITFSNVGGNPSITFQEFLFFPSCHR